MDLFFRAKEIELEDKQSRLEQALRDILTSDSKWTSKDQLFNRFLFNVWIAITVAGAKELMSE